MNQIPELTICSVYHSEAARDILELNEEFVRALNPGASWIRFAVNNSRDGAVKIRNSSIHEFPGVNIPSNAPSAGYEGYHYGAALNSLLPHVKTRFVLFLDYDFFIARPDWIREVIAHMKQEGLGLFGASYRPKYWVKFRHFPVQYCLFVDREKIGKEFYEWDFAPQYSKEHLVAGDISEAKKIAHKKAHPKTPSWGRRILENIKKRRYIGMSKDMSYDLYRRYSGQNTVKYESFGSTATLNDFLNHYYVHKRWYSILYLVEKMIPERFSFVPKQKGSYTLTRFKDRGFFDVLQAGMEEWWWQNTPFAFHLRGFKERHVKATGGTFDPEENIRAIKEITSSFLKH